MIKVSVIGYDVCFSKISEILSFILGSRASSRNGYICVSNTHQLVCGHEDGLVDSALKGSLLNVSDSQVLRALSCTKSQMIETEAFRGYDLTRELCGAALGSGYKLGFYGGTQEALNKIRATLEVAGSLGSVAYMCSPPFRALSDSELADTYREINAAGVDILFIGLGCPKQEKWMYAARNDVDALMIGVGAAFEFMANIKTPSPPWVHKLGVEWLYRLLIDPARLWKRYFKYNFKFLFFYFFKK